MQPKPIKSFREYVEQLKNHGEIVEIDKEVDWNLEMSAITRRAYELPAPAPLFKNVKGCTPGFSVLGAPVGLSPNKDHENIRVALSLGLPEDSTPTELVSEWAKLPEMERIPPRVVEDGPCKENVLTGDEIDLTKLPIPYIHVGDGGRYINTYGMFITRTPDGSWVNWAISRAMLAGKNTIASVVIPTQDTGKIYKMWQEIGEDMPLALCVGVDPAITMAAGYPLPDGMREDEVLGGWYGEPLEVVKCETCDLYVPATTEVVFEGYVSVKDRIEEGPMGEYGGYVWAGRGKTAPEFTVTCMTYRDDPIMPLCVAGVPTEENHTNWGVSISAAIEASLKEQGYPVTKSFIPYESAACWYVVAIDRNRDCSDDQKLAEEIGRAVFASKGGQYVPKVFVVDDDIEPDDLKRLVWGLATRHHPDGRVVLEDQPIFPLVPYLSQEEKAAARSTRVIYNCLTPFHGWEDQYKPVEASFRGYSDELREHVIDNWASYGY